MLFNSFSFLFLFLPIVLFVAIRLKGKWLLAWITVASFIFYALIEHAWFLLPMFITTVLDFFVALKIANATKPAIKKSLLLVSLCGNLGLLFYFKYSSFFLVNILDNLNHLFSTTQWHWDHFFPVILPAGISFYTFQTLAYIIDVYRGEAKPETNFWRFAGFVSFFPHLVAGPLTRHDQLIPALKKIETEGVHPRWEEGIFLFVIGLAKKVLIADRIASLIDPVIADMTHSGFIISWMVMIGYALQIYFDFSGYSDMAVGLGRLFGIELPRNFNKPYQSINPSDFWTRWHITLSAWLRDYLYIPLGGNHNGKTNRFKNIMITMILGGLWHGANLTFILWGFYHGALLVIYHVTKTYWDKLTPSVQKTVTFILVCFGWVFFRSSDISQVYLWFGSLFGFHGWGFPSSTINFLQFFLFIILGLLVVNLKFNANNFQGFRSLNGIQQMALGTLAVGAIIFMNYSSRFLYFQF